jgi:transposase
MQPQCTQASFCGQHVFVGIDVAQRSWKVHILVEDQFHKSFSQRPDPRALADYLRRNFPGAEYHCVYEAGYCGFWIQESLERLGLDCIVTNAADVPTSDKERRHKNDTVDAGKLARERRNGTLKAIYIPDRSSQEDRTLLRMRARFVRKQTRCKNQIKALLAFYGCRQKEDPDGLEHHWSRAYVKWIDCIAMERPSGDHALKALLKELVFLRETIADLTRQIRQLAHDDRYRTLVERLCTIPGISLICAMTLLTELISISRFTTLDRLASYAGLVPGEHSSGESERVTGITPRRNPAMRYMLIECAWIAKREDPALLLAFNELRKRMPARAAIVRIARKLLNRVRFVLRHNEPYVTGVVSSIPQT